MVEIPVVLGWSYGQQEINERQPAPAVSRAFCVIPVSRLMFAFYSSSEGLSCGTELVPILVVA